MIKQYKSIFKEAISAQIPDTNAEVIDVALDVNGNKTIVVKPFNKRSFAVMTNMNLPYIHRNVGSVKDFIGDAEAEDELRFYLTRFEKSRVRVY